MAVIVSRPGGRRASEIAPAPSYAGVVSKYASTIQAALQEEENARISQLVLDYQSGSLPWADFLTAFNAEIDKQPEGTSKRVDLEQTLFKLTEDHKTQEFNSKRSQLEAQYVDGGITATERYKIESELLSLLTPGTEDYNSQQNMVGKAYDNAIVEQIDKKRADLLNLYSPTGITNQERLKIVDELLKIPPQDSDAYRSLVGERAQVLTDIETAKNKQSSEDLTAARQLFEQADYFEKQNLADYQAGRISGAEYDAQNLANWKQVQDAMQGLKSQVEGKTLGYINSKVETLQQQVQGRASGQIFDANIADVGQPTKIEPVNVQDIVAGRKTGVVKPIVQYDAKNDVFNVIDPMTGNVAFHAGNQADALNGARALKVPGAFQVATPNGIQYYSFDNNPDSTTYNDFVRYNPQTSKVEGVFAAIPNTPQQEQSFKVPIENSMIRKSMTQKPPLGETIKQNLTDFNMFKASLGNVLGGAAKTIGDVANAPIKAAENFSGFTPGLSKINYAALGGPTSLGQSFNQAKEATTQGLQKGVSFLGGLGQKVGNFFSGLRSKTQEVNKKIFGS